MDKKLLLCLYLLSCGYMYGMDRGVDQSEPPLFELLPVSDDARGTCTMPLAELNDRRAAHERQLTTESLLCGGGVIQLLSLNAPQADPSRLRLAVGREVATGRVPNPLLGTVMDKSAKPTQKN